ncbi:uncharacterized protein V6R79_014025 [Siganus canaliculatus]
MSAELYSVNSNNEGPQSTTVGDSKPLHRFIKGQPKITGIIVLMLGSSVFIVSAAIVSDSSFKWAIIQPGMYLGILFIICGVLYIITEHNLTKKTVTISLALSIVTILSACWVILSISMGIEQGGTFRHYNFHQSFYENVTDYDEMPQESSDETVMVATEAVYLFHSTVGTIIITVMSFLAGAALRSASTRTVIVMTTTASETLAE